MSDLLENQSVSGVWTSMKREMNLVRAILMEVEQQEMVDSQHRIHIENYDPAIVNYHIHVMKQGELLSAIDVKDQSNPIPKYSAVCLTWQGHEFLEVARDETRWERAMGVVQNQGNSVTVGILIQILSSFMKSAFGLH
jgi:hypothetical protein